MTDRLYYTDAYLRDFRARVLDRSAAGRLLYLDRTAFYPASGGQPHDTGWIGSAAVVEVIDEDHRIAHRTVAPVDQDEVDCRIDWERRFDHMQQHSGQHLLSAVILREFGLHTVSFHLGEEISTIDIETPSLDAAVIAAAERRANETVCENRPVVISFEEAGAVSDLRAPTDREGTLRVVTIDRLDRSACGGTHVRLTGEIGLILLHGVGKVRNTMRLEFLCGSRAVRRARADYDALTRIAQSLSARLDETPALVAAQVEAARNAGKQRRKLEEELARYQGRELYQAAAPGMDGLRRSLHVLPSGSLEELRGLAQGFTAQSKAVFVGAVRQPPAVLLAVSPDSGLDAGRTLKAALLREAGRGGGAATLAQGSLPTAEALERVLSELLPA
jgi:alanyl-tRNA synthetase